MKYSKSDQSQPHRRCGRVCQCQCCTAQHRIQPLARFNLQGTKRPARRSALALTPRTRRPLSSTRLHLGLELIRPASQQSVFKPIGSPMQRSATLGSRRVPPCRGLQSHTCGGWWAGQVGVGVGLPHAPATVVARGLHHIGLQRPELRRLSIGQPWTTQRGLGPLGQLLHVAGVTSRAEAASASER
jgi:hypothetical protein